MVYHQRVCELKIGGWVLNLTSDKPRQLVACQLANENNDKEVCVCRTSSNRFGGYHMIVVDELLATRHLLPDVCQAETKDSG